MVDTQIVDSGPNRWAAREARRVAENPQRSMAAIGARLRATRAYYGVTLSEFGNRAGVQRSTLCHYERGQRFPALNVLAQIAEAADIPLDWLVLGRLRYSDPDFIDGIKPVLAQEDPTFSCVEEEDRALLDG
jgi:transcriptional regulator with XRE-family HTH domain